MAKGIFRDLRRAEAAATKEIMGNAQRGGRYAGAVSGEGYDGGYLAALRDVEQALRGYASSTSRYWPHPEPLQ